MWPTPQDYNEAVQQPQACFSDPDLKRSRVEVNHLGLPRPMTGAFASVYRLSNISGTSWAVRCFLEQRGDTKERYEAITRTLSQSGCDAFANFEFVERGIKIRSDWYPILKMEWIHGESLDRYIDRHVKTRAKIAGLHKQFREMLAQLRASGIAHGDLQHGNILVTDQGLRLIDYDGMFVDGLKGKVSHELGHRNFQHPDRQHNQFSLELDNFSSWVIDLSLRALVVDPDLWREFNGGDDCLLFRHRDLKSPDESAVLKLLIDHEEPDLANAAHLFAKVLRLRPERVPEYLADTEILEQLLHLESIDVINEKDNVDYRDSLAPPTIQRSVDENYDEWLASVGRTNATNRQAARATNKVVHGVKRTGRKIWSSIASIVAPSAWARVVMDEANREYDEANFASAVKLYTEAADILKDVSNSRLLYCEALIRLGYCHLEKEQLGTAAHYFREAKLTASTVSARRASQFRDNLVDVSLQASLLLAATYFELEQRERAFAELGTGIEPAILSTAVIGERDGPFGNKTTLSCMMTELGHNFLVDGNYASAYSAYEVGLESCQWLRSDNRIDETEVIAARAALGYCATLVAESREDEALKVFRELVDLERQSDLLLSLIRAELLGPLRTSRDVAEFMRLLAHQFKEQRRKDEQILAFSAALNFFRQARDTKSQLRIVDCLLGLGRDMEAVALLLDDPLWGAGLSKDICGHLAGIQDYSHALFVGTLVFDDTQVLHRYRCLDSIVARCPGIEEFGRAIEVVEATEVSHRAAFAELMVELARDLKKLNREEVARTAYSAAFRAFRSSSGNEIFGSAVMECLLAMGDLDVAAGLLLEGGKLEDMVRLMVKVMIGQRSYDKLSIVELMTRVAQTQMSKPPASVTEEEIKKTLSLLEWCAGANDPMTVKTRQDVDDWLEKREIALANSLVEQGKFAQALEVFQRYEGQNGVNVILVEELWIMRYLSAALVDRDRGYVILADGYAFGCALELLSSMKVRDAISPFFAVKVAELIQGSKLIGAEPYVQEVYRLFSSMGYEYPASILRNCLGLSKDSRPPVKPTKIVVADEAVKAGEQGDAIVLIPPGQYSDDYWQQMHRTFFYIEQEDYGIAVRELNLLLGRLDDRSRASDVFVLRGYCQFLAQDELEAERSFKLASRIRASNDEFRLHKTCLCIYLLYQTPREMHKYLRMLVEPTLAHKDVFKIATQLVGQQFNEDTKFTARLADELLRRAERGEKTQHALRIYRAVLCMLGIKNNERRLQVIMCLDGIGKHRSAARVYRCYQDFTFEDELVQQLVLRHMRSEKIDQVCQNYLEYAGLNLAAIVPQIRQEQILGVLTRVLRGYAPRRFLLNVRQDLIALHDRGQFNQDFAQSLTHQIVQETMADERAEMRSRFRNDLLAIARVVDNVDGNSGLTIRHALDFGTASSAQEKDSSMEELFIH